MPMRDRAPLVCSLIERGWQAARECSLDPTLSRARFLHLIKGRVSRSVLLLIAPRANVRVVALPKLCFWPAVWVVCLWGLATGGLRGLLVDNDRSVRRLLGWATLLRTRPLKVLPGPDGYEVWLNRQRVERGSRERLLG